MNTTKVFSNMLAVSSAGRLDAERLRRIAECKTVAEAFKMLGDYGYCYAEGTGVDGFIVGETDRLIEFVTESCASPKLCEALLARFKYNNAKLAYKSRFVEVPSDGYYKTELDVKSVADGDYSELDKYMAEALTALDEQKTDDPRDIDLALTAAMYKHIRSLKDSLVKKYFTAEIDMKNILTAARMKKLALGGDMFIDGGRIPKETLEECVSSDGFAEHFEHTPYAEYAEEIERNEFKDLWRAERDIDDHLFYLTDSAVASFTSNKPFLNYYTQTLIELKTVKTALVCVKTDSRDLFYKRIPRIYQ